MAKRIALCLMSIVMIFAGVSQAAVTTYATRTAFDLANPGLPKEDFEEAADELAEITDPFYHKYVMGNGEVLDATTDNDVFYPGDIISGIQIYSSHGESQSLAVLGVGCDHYGMPVDSVKISNTNDASRLNLSFTEGVNAVAFDILYGGPNVGVKVFDTDDVLIAGYEFELNSNFFGIYSSSELIFRVEVDSPYGPNDGWFEAIDNVSASVNTGWYGDELAADFGTNGLWHYDGVSWSRLTTWNPDDDLAGWSGGMAVDFGGEGLWNHDGTSWSKKTSWNPGKGGLTGWSGGLAVDFDADGLWVYNGTSWSKKTSWNPGNGGLAGWNGGLAVDFNAEGLWSYDGSSWHKLTYWNTGSGGLAGWSGGLGVDFDADGLWSYDGSSWRKLTSWNPEGLAGWNGSLGVDFGANGLWSYDGSSWSRLTTWNPTGMSGWGGGLAVDFGADGLWNYDGTSWSKKTSWHCENMADVDLN